MAIRDKRIGIKLTEEKKMLLQEYANSYGISMSTLCALIVGQWLHQQERLTKPVIDSLSGALRDAVKQGLDVESLLGKSL